MNSKITIAIDGYSSTGKSTIAKELAKRLGYIYVDSGAMYRAVALFAFQQKWIGTDFFQVRSLAENLKHVSITFVYNAELGFAETYLNGINVESDIRSLEISNYVSRVAAIPEVRKLLVSLQKEMGVSKGVVMDGRDIGTVVFPDAELKLFMTASPDTRAKRRYDELRAKGEEVTYQAILENVIYRDHLDTTREDSPLTKAIDAVEIDNSQLTREAQAKTIYDLTLQILRKNN
ncbi:MAG: (d)CMP kinase [Flavicella sp.]|nr:(d)CMP kinase [Flavicella sp.]